MRSTVVLCAVLMMLATVRTDALDPVRMAVSPMHAPAPATLLVRVMIAPGDRNRLLEVAADAEGFYRSSEIELAGKSGPSVVTLEFRQVPAGEYELTAVVRDGSQHQLASTRCEATVF